MRNLTARTTRGAGVRVLANALDMLLALGVGVIVARLLTPEQYGLFAMAFSVTIILERVGGLGMLAALTQRQPCTPAHETAGLLVSGGGSVVMAAGLWLAAPSLEQWMRLPGLAPVLSLTGLASLLHGLAVVPEARLQRALAFRRLALIQVSEKAVGGRYVRHDTTGHT